MELDVSLDYYDKILAAIAVSLSGGALAGTITNLRLRVGLLAGALVATTFVYHAMFRNPPRPTPSPQAKAAAIVWHAFIGILLVSAFL
ncbi:hypothetical protein ACFQJD_01635 [Haloplanus sp. GCM10025708]|uniref:hypothetical protein n=1 Tax=Haloferacaceae TaxID=1644056 RepID=UPI003622606D